MHQGASCTQGRPSRKRSPFPLSRALTFPVLLCTPPRCAVPRAPLQGAAKLGLSDGSTAIAALLQRNGTLTVANVGDSRCALVRKDGTCTALSFDHKPNRPDEKARVCAAGGWVVHQGCWRVAGDLAVSRAFGDRHLKRYGVCADPEITRFTISQNDAYLLLASDGLW